MKKILMSMLKLEKYTMTLTNNLKKLLKDKISKILSELEFKSDHLVKLKTLKYVFKRILPSL